MTGIGDMSGDVFGNLVLLSEHIKLVAAFDHRHLFIDPDLIRRPASPNGQRMSSRPGPRGPTTTRP